MTPTTQDKIKESLLTMLHRIKENTDVIATILEVDEKDIMGFYVALTKIIEEGRKDERKV